MEPASDGFPDAEPTLNYAVAVQGLRKRYGEVTAVDGLDLQVDKGEVFGMLGPNGAGKTTTVEILVGLRPADAGDVKVLGLHPGRDARRIKARIGVQLQTASLFPRLTVRETLVLFASMFPKARNVDELLTLVGLKEKANNTASKLSGGQQQRLQLAIAMINDGDLIFLDEPTTGLDPQARRNLWDIIMHLKAEGKTVFLTTHYMDEAERLCDRVAVVDRGKIIALGSPRELIDANFQETAVELSSHLALKEGLESLPGVTRLQRENGHLTLFSQDVASSIGALMALAEQKEATVSDLVVRRATLEDVFLKLTGRRIRE